MPALEHWDDSFAHLRFDGDPTEDVHMLAGLSGDVKQRAAGGACHLIGCLCTKRLTTVLM